MTKQLSIIIPVHKEKEMIKKVINDLRSTINIDFECIVVDDCSGDGTSKILKNLKKKNTQILRHALRQGYGAAIKTGIKQSQGEIICIIDGDGTYFSEDIVKLLPFINEYDMVVGARLGQSTRYFPIYQKIAKGFICNLLGFVFKRKIEDINSGLRLMKKSLVKEYAGILSDKFSFTAGITLAMLLDNRRIKYIPINYNKRIGKSKVKVVSYTWNFIKGYAKILYYLKLDRTRFGQ